MPMKTPKKPTTSKKAPPTVEASLASIAESFRIIAGTMAAQQREQKSQADRLMHELKGLLRGSRRG